MRRGRAHLARASAVAVVAAALGACNALTGLSDDYHLGTDGGGEPGPDGVAADGRAPDVEGGSDGARSDASYCATIDAANEELCLDFDDPTKDAGGTIYQRNVASASVKVAAGEGKDGTGALVVHHQRTSSAPSSHVWFAMSLPQTAAPREFEGYEIEYDVRTSTTALEYVALGILTFPDDWASEYGTALYQDVISKLPPQGDGAESKGTWHHVSIRLTRGSGSTSFTRVLKLDGQQLDSSSYTPPTTGTSEVRVGAFNSSVGAGDVTTYFDDLVIRRWK